MNLKVAKRQCPRNMGGFSLFELLVVLIIMSVTLGLFLGFNFRQQAAVELRGQGHAIVQLMRAAQSMAIVRGVPNKCLYDPEDKTVRTTLGGRRHTLPSPVELRIGDLRIEERVELAVFYPDGAAETENISLHSMERDQSVSIQIDPLFGDIQLADQ